MHDSAIYNTLHPRVAAGHVTFLQYFFITGMIMMSNWDDCTVSEWLDTVIHFHKVDIETELSNFPFSPRRHLKFASSCKPSVCFNSSCHVTDGVKFHKG